MLFPKLLGVLPTLRRTIGIARTFANKTPLVTISETPNPKTYVYSVTGRQIPRTVVYQVSQHGSVSDIHQINESSIAVTFFQAESVLPSVREEVREELGDLLNRTPIAVEVDVPTERQRPKFDPESNAGRVDSVISERIRPGVNADGGDVELVQLTDDGIAIVRMMGSCNGCPSSAATLKGAIEKTLLFFCGDIVKEVQQAPTETETIKSEDVMATIATEGLSLPSVISHHHVGQPMQSPLNGKDFPVVSLFARQVDEKLIQRVKYASTVTIPKNASSGIDVWVNCGDCGAKKRLEDVDRLIQDAKERVSHVDRVAVVICPACAVIVREA
jgi:Fe-S cluster biogenesis protein NfuA